MVVVVVVVVVVDFVVVVVDVVVILLQDFPSPVYPVLQEGFEMGLIYVRSVSNRNCRTNRIG